MTPDKLRDIAWALDALSDLTREVYQSVAIGGQINAATVTIELDVTKHGEPMSAEDAAKIVAWVDSDEMQDDLRRWADEMEDMERLKRARLWASTHGRGKQIGWECRDGDEALHFAFCDDPDCECICHESEEPDDG